MRDQEHQFAVAFMVWWAYNCKRYGVDERLLFAVPNGGHRHIGTAKKLKAEGVRAGIADYVLCASRWGYHAMFIELKVPGGRLSPDQKEVGKLLIMQGYKWAVAYGTNEAIETVEKYLKPERKQDA